MVKEPASYLLWEPSQPISPFLLQKQLGKQRAFYPGMLWAPLIHRSIYLGLKCSATPWVLGLYFIRNLVLFPFQKQWVVTLAHTCHSLWTTTQPAPTKEWQRKTRATKLDSPTFKSWCHLYLSGLTYPRRRRQASLHFFIYKMGASQSHGRIIL